MPSPARSHCALLLVSVVALILGASPVEAGEYLPWKPMPLPVRTTPADEDPLTPPGNVVSYNLETGETVYRLASPALFEEGMLEFEPGQRGEAPEATDSGRGGPQPNFGPYYATATPSAFPYSTHVRLAMSYINADGDTANYMCSGTLIDPMHVVTAGHCVYSHNNGEGWAFKVTVVPAYTNGVMPFGYAQSVELHSWSGWTSSDDSDHDVALVDLDRPIGSLAGWRGYGYSNDCDFFTGGSWAHHAYPADDGYDGLTMQTNDGDFDGCDDTWGSWYGNEVWADRPGIHGTSGGGAIRNSVVWAVRSNTTSDVWGDRDAFDCRITSGKYSDIGSWIAADIGTTPDLIPIDVRSPLNGIMAGDYLQVFDVGVTNYATSAFAGTLQLNAYLSTDPYISVSDELLGSYSGYWEIGSRGFVRVGLPGWQIPPGTPAGRYYLGVIITNADGNTSNNGTLPGESDTLWVGCPPVGSASGYSPAFGTTCVATSTMLSWSAMVTAAGYEVQVGTACGNGQIYASSTPYLAVSGLSAGTEYYWRVRASSTCSPGTWGPWGDCMRFRTADAMPGYVTLTSPPSGSQCKSIGVVFDWEPEVSADLYHVQVGTACGSGTIYIADSGTDITVTGLLYNTTYYWRVRGRSGCGELGPWSACRSFTTAPSALPAPVVTGPDDGATCVSAGQTLSWNPVSGADYYALRYGPSGCFSNADTTIVVGGTSAALPMAETGTTYLWSVFALDQCGGYGVSSSCRSFTLAEATLDPVGGSMEPGNAVACVPSSVHLSWDAVAGATGYLLEFGGVCGGSPLYSTILDGYDFTGLAAGEYRWRMRVRNACGAYGSWSDCLSFNVDATAPGQVGSLASSTHAVSTWSNADQITFTWAAPKDLFGSNCGTIRYSVVLDLSSTTHPDTNPDTDVTTWTTAPLADGVGRWFHVRAIDEAGNVSAVSSHLGPFMIDTVAPKAEVLQPNGRESWTVGTEQKIRLLAVDNRSGVREILLSYSTDGGTTFTPIASLPPGTDEYPWTVPDTPSTSVKVAIAVTDSAGTTSEDKSDASFAITLPVGAGDPPGPIRTALRPNAPNPFRASTTVRFALAEEGEVSLTILDARSRVVRTLFGGTLGSGEHALTWDGRDDMGRRLGAGIYFLRMTTGNGSLIRRMLLLH